MQGDPEIIETLNQVLTGELTAVNQYFLHSKLCANWGYQRLAEHAHDESIGEMKDADAIIERILLLEGHPNLQRLGTVSAGESVPEQFEADAALERAAIERLRAGIEQAYAASDHGTRELFEHILVGEESHLDWIETQQRVIAEIGEAHYLAQQLHD
jgi:bacterioferritin